MAMNTQLLNPDVEAPDESPGGSPDRHGDPAHSEYVLDDPSGRATCCLRGLGFCSPTALRIVRATGYEQAFIIRGLSQTALWIACSVSLVFSCLLFADVFQLKWVETGADMRKTSTYLHCAWKLCGLAIFSTCFVDALRMLAHFDDDRQQLLAQKKAEMHNLDEEAKSVLEKAEKNVKDLRTEVEQSIHRQVEEYVKDVFKIVFPGLEKKLRQDSASRKECGAIAIELRSILADIWFLSAAMFGVLARRFPEAYASTKDDDHVEALAHWYTLEQWAKKWRDRFPNLLPSHTLAKWDSWLKEDFPHLSDAAGHTASGMSNPNDVLVDSLSFSDLDSVHVDSHGEPSNSQSNAVSSDHHADHLRSARIAGNALRPVYHLLELPTTFENKRKILKTKSRPCTLQLGPFPFQMAKKDLTTQATTVVMGALPTHLTPEISAYNLSENAFLTFPNSADADKAYDMLCNTNLTWENTLAATTHTVYIRRQHPRVGCRLAPKSCKPCVPHILAGLACYCCCCPKRWCDKRDGRSVYCLSLASFPKIINFGCFWVQIHTRLQERLLQSLCFSLVYLCGYFYNTYRMFEHDPLFPGPCAVVDGMDNTRCTLELIRKFIGVLSMMCYIPALIYCLYHVEHLDDVMDTMETIGQLESIQKAVREFNTQMDGVSGQVDLLKEVENRVLRRFEIIAPCVAAPEKVADAAPKVCTCLTQATTILRPAIEWVRMDGGVKEQKLNEINSLICRTEEEIRANVTRKDSRASSVHTAAPASPTVTWLVPSGPSASAVMASDAHADTYHQFRTFEPPDLENVGMGTFEPPDSKTSPR